MNAIIAKKYIGLGLVIASMTSALAEDVELDVKILRIPKGSGFDLTSKESKSELPNPLVAGIQTAEQISNTIKTLIDNQSSSVIYANRFVAVDGRRFETIAEVDTIKIETASSSMDLRITPQVEGNAVRLSVGMFGENDGSPSPLNFESKPVLVGDKSGAVFSTRDPSQAEPDHYIVFVTPKIIK